MSIKITGQIIHKNPVIILVGLNGQPDAPASFLSHDLFLDIDEKYYFFMNPMFTFSRPSFLETILKELNKQIKKFTQHRYVLLLNDGNELGAVKPETPCEIYICGEHSCVNTNIFEKFICTDSEKIYDGTYIAQNAPLKRINLIEKIEKISLITSKMDRNEFLRLKSQNPTIKVHNFLNADENYKKLNVKDIFEILTRSRCGIILSPYEAQCRAVAEYLLAGLPVLTTPSIGGRERFLTPSNSVICDPSETGIKNALDYFRTHSYEPKGIIHDFKTSVLKERKWLGHIINTVIQKDGFRPVNIFNLNIAHNAFSNTDLLSSQLHILGRK